MREKEHGRDGTTVSWATSSRRDAIDARLMHAPNYLPAAE